MVLISATKAEPPDEPGTRLASFDDHYRTSCKRMVKLASLLMASKAIGEELVQDAYLEAFQKWDTINNPDAFLRTLVVRRCKRASWRIGIERQRLDQIRRDNPYSAATKGDHEVDGTLEVLRVLKPERRAVVVLRFYEDMSHSQIARVLGCSEATVRTRLHRALAQLRTELP